MADVLKLGDKMKTIDIARSPDKRFVVVAAVRIQFEEPQTREFIEQMLLDRLPTKCICELESPGEVKQYVLNDVTVESIDPTE